MPIPANQMINVEFVINGTCAAAGSNSRSVQSIYHYRRTSTVNAFNKAHIATAFINQVINALKACLSVRYTGINVWTRCIDDAMDAYTYTAETHAGSITGDSMPTTDAVYLEYQTGLRGKSFRGGKHFFPIGESATTVLTDDILNAGAITYFTTLATALAATFPDSDGNTWQPEVLSKKLSQLRKNPTNVVAYDVTAIVLNKRIGTMRHRKVKSVF